MKTVKETSQLMSRKIIGDFQIVTYKCLVNMDWTMLFLSDNILELSGFPANEFLGLESKRTYSSIIHPDDRDSVTKEVAKANVMNEGFEIFYRIVHKDGMVVKVFEKGKFVKEDFTNNATIEGMIVKLDYIK